MYPKIGVSTNNAVNRNKTPQACKAVNAYKITEKFGLKCWQHR